MLIKRQIKITLRSDLCIGSGYSFAGLIDSDVCYDDCGIPYIPARRLKGCMREAAQTTLYQILTEDKINAVFGKRGQHAASGIFIGDARIDNYEKIHSELKFCMTNKMKGHVTPQKILNTYTSIKAQTKIEEESKAADDLTLRFTRTVNQINSLTKKEIVFFADIVYEQSLEDDLLHILRATRNIGLHRNRGLGAVKLEWNNKNENLNTLDYKLISKSKKPMIISYRIKNLEPLMLPSQTRDSSVDYISGQSIIGMMADRYLKKYGQANEVFHDLFLNGTVKYTNATLCAEDHTFYPAPAYLAKLKLHKHIVNTYMSGKTLPDTIENPEEYQADDGNLPKKLKGKYVCMISEQECAIKDVKRTLIYHNRIHDEDEPGTHLYNHEAIAVGQTFAAQIFLPEKYLNMVEDLLSEKYAWFGKSKTAQYGMCEIKVENHEDHKTSFQAKKGDTILVTLLSDGIFIKKDKDYTVYEDDLHEIIANELGSNNLLPYKENTAVSSMITTKEIHGYQSMWNLRRQPVPGVCAGSVFVFTAEKDVTISRNFIGERNQEGYGQIRITNLKEMQYYPVKEVKFDSTKLDIENTKEFVEAILLDELYQEVKQNFMEQVKDVKLKSSALLGRVTLMLKESQEQFKEDPHTAFTDFSKRILSMKATHERDKLCREILEKIAQKDKESENEIESYHLESGKIQKLIEKDSECIRLLEGQSSLDYLQNKWADLLMAVLTKMKYELKHQISRQETVGTKEE